MSRLICCWMRSIWWSGGSKAESADKFGATVEEDLVKRRGNAVEDLVIRRGNALRWTLKVSILSSKRIIASVNIWLAQRVCDNLLRGVLFWSRILRAWATTNLQGRGTVASESGVLPTLRRSAHWDGEDKGVLTVQPFKAEWVWKVPEFVTANPLDGVFLWYAVRRIGW